MKNVKTPTSDSWLDALIESLRDSQEAADYIEAILQEKTPEHELLREHVNFVGWVEERNPTLRKLGWVTLRLYPTYMSATCKAECGGDKSTQAQDIRKAKEYWKDYERRENTNK